MNYIWFGWLLKTTRKKMKRRMKKMFEVGKKYWFTQKGTMLRDGTTKEKFVMKAKVLEETPFLLKVECDSGVQKFIVTSNLIDVNEAKD